MAKTGSKRKQSEKDSGHVAFSAEDDKEFSIPYRDQQGMDFESLVSGTNKSGFLDEIALLKKGIITKDTPKHTYRRASAEIVKEPIDEESPITMAELNTRGLRLSKDQVIYSVPEGTIEAIQKLTNPEPRSSNSNDRRYGSSQSESSSTLSRANSVTQMWDGSGKVIKQCIQPGTNSKEFHVGNPNENARMKISNLKDGYSYKLSIKDDVCLLQKTSKASAFDFLTSMTGAAQLLFILWSTLDLSNQESTTGCQQITAKVSGQKEICLGASLQRDPFKGRDST